MNNIYVRFGGQLVQQIVGILMGTNCAALLADLFLYSYENEFLDKLIKEGKRKLARKFNLSFTLMTLSLSMIKDLRSSFLIFTPKNLFYNLNCRILEFQPSVSCWSIL